MRDGRLDRAIMWSLHQRGACNGPTSPDASCDFCVMERLGIRPKLPPTSTSGRIIGIPGAMRCTPGAYGAVVLYDRHLNAVRAVGLHRLKH